MSEAQKLYSQIGDSLNGAESSNLFDKPCYKVNGKAFICFFQDEMVFKLAGDAHQEALSLDGSQLFDPSGKKRPMKEWVQVGYMNHNLWEQFAKDAMKYVESN